MVLDRRQHTTMTALEFQQNFSRHNNNSDIRNQISQIFTEMKTPEGTTASQSYLNYIGSSGSNISSRNNIQYRSGEP